MKNIIRLILQEVIMSDRHTTDGHIHSFLQLFLNTEKIRLNWRLDSTVTDYMLHMCVAYIHCDITLINNAKIKKYEKIHATWLSSVFPFDIKFLFLTVDTEE